MLMPGMGRRLRAAAAAALVLAAAIPGASLAQRVGESFGDWVVECTALAANQTLCSINQTLISGETRQPLIKYTVSRNPQTGAAVLMTVMPLGVDLTVPITGSVDGAAGFTYMVEACLAVGCLATHTLTPVDLLAMKNGDRLELTVRMRGEQQMSTLAGSLAGFGAGVGAIGLE